MLGNSAFKALRMCGVSIDHILVRALAIQFGWAANAADRLANIAQRFHDGRRVQAATISPRAPRQNLVARFETLSG